MTEPVLRIADLTIARYDGEALVRGLDLTISAGEIAALVGESGSGKSLTGRAVLGLLPEGLSATGTIELDGSGVLGRAERDLRALRGPGAALVFQEPQSALNPSQRIWRQIYEVLRAHHRVDRSTARIRAVDLLDDVGIPDPDKRVDWYPHQLSGGQKQRVVIALALAAEPRLLIADEPTTALDVTVQAQILALLRDLRDRRGVAILLISHNLGVVADLADSVTVVRRGELIESGAVDDVFAAPKAQYTRDLLAAVPRLSGTSPIGPNDSPDNGTGVGAVTGVDDETERSVVVSARGLTVNYPGADQPALRSVDLTVHAGEVVGLIGESGSGKSTLGRVLLGLEAHSFGQLDVRTARRALIHQAPYSSLDPRWTVRRIVTEPLALAGERNRSVLRRRAAELIASVRLPAEVIDARPRELSGGQRQRVAFARALASSPELLIADEPTSALDVSVQASVLELFSALHAQFGFAAVFITHDLAVVSEVADRTVVLRRGEVIEEGASRTLLAAPESDYTRELVAAVPVPDPAAQRARRESGRQERRANGEPA